MSTTKRRTFCMGRIFITPGAEKALDIKDQSRCLLRHATGDWGEMCEEDKAANDKALERGGRLFSAYRNACGTKFWIITEQDRSATTILLPEEY